MAEGSSGASVLVVPDLGGSGPGHWQSIWQARNPDYRRVEQRDWDEPDLEGWLSSLETAVREAPSPVVLVAHSLACSLVAHWARRGSHERVDAAMLVSPADVDSEARTPPEARRFAPMPLEELPFRTVVVASSNDPYVDPERARYFAHSWGARLTEAGPQGHINTGSGTASGPRGSVTWRSCWRAYRSGTCQICLERGAALVEASCA